MHASRSVLLNKIETYRHEEEALLKRLADAVTDNDMTSNLTPRERQELQDDLECCRVKQAEEIVVSVNQYQPKMKKKVNKNATSTCTSGNLYTQSIEQILADAFNDSRSIASRSPRVIKAKSSIQSNRSKRLPNSVKGASKTGLLLNSTNSRKTEQAVLEDSDHFILTVHELAIRNKKFNEESKPSEVQTIFGWIGKVKHTATKPTRDWKAQSS
eukprot:scaffold46389_cov23-Cyclotella_meneghiniana.AAC.1